MFKIFSTAIENCYELQLSKISDDRGFFSMVIQKYRTTSECFFISFELKKLNNDKESPVNN